MQFPFPKYILLSSPFQISIKLNIDLFILKESFRKEEIIYICSDGNRLFSTLLVATLKIIMLGQTAGASLNQFLQGIKKSLRKEDLICRKTHLEYLYQQKQSKFWISYWIFNILLEIFIFLSLWIKMQNNAILLWIPTKSVSNPTMIASETEWNFLELSQFDGNSCMPHQAGVTQHKKSFKKYINLVSKK